MTNWLQYFQQEMNKRGIKTTTKLFDGPVPPAGTTIEDVLAWDDDRIIASQELSAKSAEATSFASIWCEEVYFGPNPIEKGYNFGMELRGQDDNAVSNYHLMGKNAYHAYAWGGDPIDSILAEPDKSEDHENKPQSAQELIDLTIDLYLQFIGKGKQYG